MKVSKDRIDISHEEEELFNYLISISNELEEVLKVKGILRSKFIVILIHLELICNLYLIYELSIDNMSRLKYLSKCNDSENYKKFINAFVLNQNNDYYKNNIENLKRLNAKDFISLRNNLIHFYSTTENIIIYDSSKSTEAKERNLAFQNNSLGHVIHISEKDIYELTKSAGILFFSFLANENINQSHSEKIEKLSLFLKENASIGLN